MQPWAWLATALAVVNCRELDPAACGTRFDVQRDKIIRTEESREMGARYLSELDVGTRDECLRLCCETDQCDVFVYEEKNPGSCYLFNCGPPEDFRCKFTQHTNFSSGVLALSRRLAELQDQERLAQHERELANLRVVHTSSTTKLPSTTPPVQPPAPAVSSVPQLPPPRRCSRYQFECHSGGECIAVYNACDGIAQCADGSDEAPELGCPAPAHPVPPTSPPPIFVQQKDISEGGVEPDVNIIQESGALAHWPHRLVQAQPSHYNEQNNPSSHIFSHKGGLLQEAENPNLVGNALQQYNPAFEAPWQRRTWTQPSQGMEGMSPNNAAQRGWNPAAGGSYGRYREWGEPPPDQRAWPVPQPPSNREPDLPVYLPPKTMPETPMIYSSEQETLRDSPKKGFELVKKHPIEQIVTDSNINAVKTTTKAPETVETNKSKTPVNGNKTQKKDLKDESTSIKNTAESEKKPEEHSMHHDRYEMTPDDHDGLDEHPPAAVFLLVLGILMTSVMVVMLGCRLRMARRRLRRGKSPFAHDADYLVNGMYL